MKQPPQQRKSGTVGRPRPLGFVDSEDRRRVLGAPSSTVRAAGMAELGNSRVRKPSYKRSSMGTRSEKHFFPTNIRENS